MRSMTLSTCAGLRAPLAVVITAERCEQCLAPSPKGVTCSVSIGSFPLTTENEPVGESGLSGADVVLVQPRRLQWIALNEPVLKCTPHSIHDEDQGMCIQLAPVNRMPVRHSKNETTRRGPPPFKSEPFFNLKSTRI